MKPKLLDLIDFEKVNVLLEGVNESTGFVTAILDLEGNVLSQSGWRRICTDFHRVHPETSKRCTISDTVLAGKLAEGEKYHFYKCLNGLVDVAVPLVINGEHIANIFSGQFFFEEPNKSFFQKQANTFGFNENNYLNALIEVPIVSEEKVKKVMAFLLNMTELISNMVFQKAEQLELIEALKESEERWHFALESNGDGVWDWNALTNKVFFSKRWKEMLGYQEDEIANDFSEWDKLLHPDEKEKNYITLNKHLKGETEMFMLEHRIKCKDGSYKWILSRGKVISRTKENKPIRIIGTHIDLTLRKQAEGALILEKEFSEKIIDTSTAIIIGLDKDHIIKIFNKGAENITGYTSEEVIGKDWYQIFFPNEMLDEMNKVWKEVWGIPAHAYENPILVKSGEERLISWQSTGIYEGEDTSKHLLISIGEDITNRHNAEAKVIVSEANIKSLIENRADSIWSVDKNINFIIFNSYFAKSYKSAYHIELQKGMNAIEILSSEAQIFWKQKYEAVLKGENIVFEFSERIAGSVHYFQVSMNPIVEEEKIKGVSALSIEITELKKAEEELKKYHEQLEELVKERTQELENKNSMLEKINKAFVGRELRMVELKKEIEKLKKSGVR